MLWLLVVFLLYYDTLASVVPGTVPGVPRDVVTVHNDSNSLRFLCSPPWNVKPEGSNGAPITHYGVQTTSRVNEVQVVKVESTGPSITSGKFKLTFENGHGSDTTHCMEWNSTADGLQRELNGLMNIDGVKVERSLNSNGFTYTVEFNGEYLVNGDQSLVMVPTVCTAFTPLAITPTCYEKVKGVKGHVPEVWEIQSSGDEILDGHFELSIGFDGEMNNALGGAVSVAAGSSTVDTSGGNSCIGKINRGDKIKIGDQVFYVHASAPFTDNVLPLDSYHTSGAVGVTPYAQSTAMGNVIVTQNSNAVVYDGDWTASLQAGDYVRIDGVEFTVNAIVAGTITLGQLDDHTIQTNWLNSNHFHLTLYKRRKATLRTNVDAMQMKWAIEQLPQVGTVHVQRDGPNRMMAYTWRVTFLSLPSGTNCPSAPCLHTSTNALLTDIQGGTCTNCQVQSTRPKYKNGMHASSIQRVGLAPEFDDNGAAKWTTGVTFEVQSILVSSTAGDLDGSFALNFKVTTPATDPVYINFDDNAQDMKTKLESLPTVGIVNVTRETTNVGYSWTISFASNVGNLPLIAVADTSTLMGTDKSVQVTEVVQGNSGLNDIVVGGLDNGKRYASRVYALNTKGSGESSFSDSRTDAGNQPLSKIAASKPSMVSVSSASATSKHSVDLAITPTSHNGLPISKYIVEASSDANFGTPEVKKLDIFNTAENDTVGTFKLSYGNYIATALLFDAKSSQVKAALQTLPNLHNVHVSRAPYVVSGTVADKVTDFDAGLDKLTVTALSYKQASMLTKGTPILIDSDSFTVLAQPSQGDTEVYVQSGHGIADFAAVQRSIVKVNRDTESSPLGYTWYITFSGHNGPAPMTSALGLTISSSVETIETGSMTTTITDAYVAGVAAANYFRQEVSLSDDCGSYVVGKPSRIQYIKFSADSTITDGSYKLKLGNEETSCISFDANTLNVASAVPEVSLRTALLSLSYVSDVTVEEFTDYQERILSGGETSKVISYDGDVLTIASGLSAGEVAMLLVGTKLQASRNHFDTSSHSCEFTVQVQPSTSDTTIDVAAVGTCANFVDDRALSMFTMKSYRIAFHGEYPDAVWPTLELSSFGSGTCTAFAPVSVNPKGLVHTMFQEGTCVLGARDSQTIVADGTSTLGGYFTISTAGKMSNSVSVVSTSASKMKEIVEDLISPLKVSVVSSTHNTHGKAWKITLESTTSTWSKFAISDAFVSGSDAGVNVFSTVTIRTSASKNDISGTFRVRVGNEQTESISYDASNAKLLQELHKLDSIAKVSMLGTSVGESTVTLQVDVTNGSPLVTQILKNTVSVDPYLTLTVGEAITIDGVAYEIGALTSADITLTANYAGTTGSKAASAGTHVSSMTKLPGMMQLASLYNVEAVTSNSNVFTFPSGHGYTTADKFSINGQYFEVTSVVGQVVTMTTNYVGDTITASNPVIPIYDNKLAVSQDLSGHLAMSDKLWLQVGTDQMSEFVVLSIDTKLVQVSGVFENGVVDATGYFNANGHEWTIVFKSKFEPMGSVEAIPDISWRGSNTKLLTTRSDGKQPYIIGLGNKPEVQVITLAADSTADVGVGATYTLTFRGETTASIAWDADSTMVKQGLEAIATISTVAVETVALGNGYVHQVSFLGKSYFKTVPLMTSAFSVANAAAVSITHATLREGYAIASIYDHYASLVDDTTYYFRINACNDIGCGDFAVDPATAVTGAVATPPLPPQSVVLGNEYGSDWLSVHYSAPKFDGGFDINKYRIEWDSSTEFSSQNPDFGVMIPAHENEVQQILSSFGSGDDLHTRGGSFMISWGGRKSSALSFDCSADTMAAQIRLITGNVATDTTAVKVVRNVVSWGYSWKVTFLKNKGDLSLLVPDYTFLEGDDSLVTVSEVVKGNRDIAPGDFTYEVQEVFTSAVSALSGTFVLQFEGKLTSSISVDASALEMEQALQALSTIHTAKVSKGIIDTTLNTAYWTVTFAHLVHEQSTGAGNIHLMRLQSTSLSGVSAAVSIVELVRGSTPLQISLPNLTQGRTYYLRVMAYNSGGYSSVPAYSAKAIPKTHPGAPTMVVSKSTDSSSIGVTWAEPTSNGGSKIDQYMVEWYSAVGTFEQQTITTSAESGINEIQDITVYADTNSLGGYFKIGFDGQWTYNIKWNAAASEVEERLLRLSSIGTVDVSRADSKRAVPKLLVTATGTTATVHASSGVNPDVSGIAVNDVIWIEGSEHTITALTSTTITFTPAFVGTITTAVPVYEKTWGYTWSVTFGTGHVGEQILFDLAPSDNWAGVNAGLTSKKNVNGLQPIAGYFSLSMESNDMTHSTTAIPFDASASVVKKHLEEISTISTVNVQRERNGFGFNWVVSFTTEFKSDIGLLSANGNGLTGPSSSIFVARTLTGVSPSTYCEYSSGTNGCIILTATNEKNAQITPLVKGQGYMVRVRAHNGDGWGNAGYPSPTSQIPSSKPDSPRSISLLALSSSLLKLVWYPPMDNGGVSVTKYRVEWDTSSTFANVGTPDFDYFFDVTPNTDVSLPLYYNIPVDMATTIYVRVYAINNRGTSAAGVPTPTSLIASNQPPGQPVEVTATTISNTGIWVQWKHPSVSLPKFGGNGGQPVSQYMIEWDTSDDFDSPASYVLVNSDITEYTIGGNDVLTGQQSDDLTAGGTYFVRMTAFNSLGAGAYVASNPSSVDLSDQAPSVPRNLTLAVASATSVDASWVEPKFDGGSPLKSYTVFWDSQADFLSGIVQQQSVPVVKEMQIVTVSSDVTNEEQNIDATVKVKNERQTLRTTVTGVDEVQVIRTTNDAVVDEIQTITTTATDINEVQEIRLTADDVNEVQTVQTYVAAQTEIQRIIIGAQRINEVQTIQIEFPATVIGDLGTTTGSFVLRFDSTQCTYCVVANGQNTAAITINNEGTPGINIESALNALTNTDTVTVTRSDSDNAGTLVLVYSIVFSGDAIAGDVPEVTIQAGHSLANNAATPATVPNTATELTKGNEPSYSGTSNFNILYTCEQYSDPTSSTGHSTACATETELCATCGVSFDGATTITTDAVVAVVANDHIRVANCVFQVVSSTATTITVVDDVGVGKYCNQFNGGYRIAKFDSISTSAIPIKATSTDYTLTSVVVSALQAVSAVGTVSVTGAEYVSATLVGQEYTVTFNQKSGTLPLLQVNLDALEVTNPTAVCPGVGCSAEVTRTQIGSMIYGSYTLGLARQSDNVVATSAAIPWDASDAELKSIVEAVANTFGTVSVTRTAYMPDAKWTGGYTWTIEFTSRGWDIPIVVPTSSLSSTDGGAPSITPVEQVKGNEIAGTFDIQLNGVTSTIALSTNSISGSWDTASTQDTDFETALEARSDITDISVYRSAASQAKGFTWTITFTHADNGGDISLMTIPSNVLTGTNVQISVVETVKGNQLSGSFQLQFDGQLSAPIVYSSTAAAMETQLNSLSSIMPSFVAISRSGPDTIDLTKQVLGYTWSVTFRSSQWADPTSDHSAGITGNWKGPAALWDDVWPSGHSKAWGKNVGALDASGLRISCVGTSLTTSTSDGSQSCTTAVFQSGVSPLKGSFTISLDSSAAPHMSVKAAHTSASVQHNAWATAAESGSNGESVEEILESMANVGDVTVSRSAVDMTTGGYVWTVTFVRDIDGPCEQVDTASQLCNAPGDVPTITVTSSLVGANPLIGGCGITPVNVVCDANCVGVCMNGILLRGNFNAISVTGDPGYVQGCQTCVVSCGGGDCTSFTYIDVTNDADTLALLQEHLAAGDSIRIGASAPACILPISGISAGRIDFSATGNCAGVAANDAINIILPWNAEASAMERAIAATADYSLRSGIWSGGRKTVVERTVIGKYGEVSWFIRFISNPGQTPPGAGNIADLAATSASFTTSLTVNQEGSTGLSGSFDIDFHTQGGSRQIEFDEVQERFRRKLEEMSTIGKVYVKRYRLPSSDTGCTTTACAGGWDDISVDNDGTKGGYRWKIRFLQNPGSYLGETFPRGSGNVETLTVSTTNLAGADKSVIATSVTDGSSPISGSFTLTHDGSTTNPISYSASLTTMEERIETLKTIGSVTVEKEDLTTYRIPNAIATIGQNQQTATVSNIDDIRLYLSPGDIVRFGPSSGTFLDGTNGEVPISGTSTTSLLNAVDMSPLFTTNDPLETFLYPSQSVRVDGSVYDVLRTGMEMQTLTIKVPTNTWDLAVTTTLVKLDFLHSVTTSTTAQCIAMHADASTVQTELNGLSNVANTDITVTRSDAMLFDAGANMGYVYTINFGGTSVLGNVNELVLNAVGCTGIGAAVISIATIVDGGHVAHQKVELYTNGGTVVDTTGYFKVSYNSVVAAACIKWGASADDLKTALVSTAQLATSDIYVVRFGSGASKTEVQQIIITSNAPVSRGASGLYKLSFTHDGSTETTACLHYGITADEMQAAIDGLANVPTGHVNVTVAGDASAIWGYGYVYTLEFSGPLSSSTSTVVSNVLEFVVHEVGTGTCSTVASGSPSVRVLTVTEGAPAYSYDVFFVGLRQTQTPLITLSEQGTGSACATGWTHTGGSSRNVNSRYVAIGGSDEIQQVTISDATTPIVTTPEFQLYYSVVGQISSCIAYNADAATVKAAIEAIANIGVAGTQVSDHLDPISAPNGKIFKITFTGSSVRGNIEQLQILHGGCAANFASTSSVAVSTISEGGGSAQEIAMSTGYHGTAPGSHVGYVQPQTFMVTPETIEVQQLIVQDTGGTFDSGDTFSITYGASTVAGVKWDASENELEANLASLTGITAGDVQVSRTTDTALAPNGYIYTIYFSGTSVAGDLTLLSTSAPVGFSGTGSAVITSITDGSVSGLLSANTIPLSTMTTPTAAATFYGPGGNFAIYKLNGFLWKIIFDTNIGDISKLISNTGSFVGTMNVFDNFVTGSPSNSQTISGLQSGIQYHFKVSATTAIGTSDASSSVSTTPCSVPMAPQNVFIGPSYHVDEVQTIMTAASHIDEVQKITTLASTIPEVQSIIITSSACGSNSCVSGNVYVRFPSIQKITVSAAATITGGTYVITFTKDQYNVGTFTPNTQASSAIAWNADAATMAAALNALTDVEVTVDRFGDGTVDSAYGYTYSVTFTGSGVLGEIQPLVVSDPTTTCGGSCTAFIVTGGVGTATDVTATVVNSGRAMGTDTEIQKLTISADLALYAGEYQISLNHAGGSQTSTCISYDASADALKTALEALPNIDMVYVTREQDATAAPNGYVYSILFTGNGVSGNINEMTTTTAGCTAFQTLTNNVLTTTGVNDVQTVSTIDNGGDDAGNTFLSASSGTAAELKADLELLPIIQTLEVSRSAPDDQGGLQWAVAFSENDGNVAQLVCTGNPTFNANCGFGTVTNGNNIQGSFTIDASNPISHDATAMDMKTALEAVPSIGTVDVYRSDATSYGGYSWLVTFTSYLGDVPILTASNSLSGVGNAITISEEIRGNYLSGNFTLSLDGHETQAIDFDAAATSVDSSADGTSMQERLQALPNIGTVTVVRSDADTEGGRSWVITFTDHTSNAGDISLIHPSAANLNGTGASVSVYETTKGADATGDRLWLSYESPIDDGGGDIDEFKVSWDTASNFLAVPQQVTIPDSGVHGKVQVITAAADSLTWSSIKQARVNEVQTVSVIGATGTTFDLTFRGETTGTITVDTTTFESLKTMLEALTTISSVSVNAGTGSSATIVTTASDFSVTFTGERGPLSIMTADASVATIATTSVGVTNYRKEVVAFTCSESATDVTFTLGSETSVVANSITLASLKTTLEGLTGVLTDGVTIMSHTGAQSTLCTGTPEMVYITFNRNHGDISLSVTSGTANAVTLSTAKSIDGIIQGTTSVLSGTFEIQYGSNMTMPISSESTASEVRAALEALQSITTVTVTRDYSKKLISGGVDAVNGQVYVTCSSGETCNFDQEQYGVPGQRISIGGTWYLVGYEPTTSSMPTDKLYLADGSGNQIAYVGDTMTNVPVYEWNRGYEWTVMVHDAALPLALFRPNIHRLSPTSSTVKVAVPACKKCHYIPNGSSTGLSMGETYYAKVQAHNSHGSNTDESNIASGIPREVPNAPANIDLRIVSGTELEIYFSPPTLAPFNVDSTYNDDISSYIVQWDTSSDFKHGKEACSSCATSLSGNSVSCSADLTTLLPVASKFTIDDNACVYTVTAITTTVITATHSCTAFSSRTYAIKYYTIPTAAVSGLAISGTPPFKHVISSLTSGTKYYVRVAAVNSVPVQIVELEGAINNRRWSDTVSATPIDTVPSEPTGVQISARSGTSLKALITPPLRDGKGTSGAAITHYVIDVDTTSTFDSSTKVTPVDTAIGSLPELYSGGPLVHYITGLTTGTTYYVQVKAKNSEGYSSYTVATNPSAPSTSPNAVSTVRVTTLTESTSPITTAMVTWGKPSTSSGLDNSNYKVEWWSDQSRNEIQVVELAWAAAPTGSFTLAYSGQLTGQVPFDVTPANLRNLLMGILDGASTVIGNVDIARSALNGNLGYQWSITFKDSTLNGGDIPLLQMDASAIVGGTTVTNRVFEAVSGVTAGTATVAGKNEVQAIVSSSATSTVTGYFRISFEGSSWSPYVSADATTSEVKDALEQLSTIGQVTVTKGSGGNGNHWFVTFTTNTGNVPAMLVDGDRLSPSDATLEVKDGDNVVDSTGVKCLPGIGSCPGSTVWSGYQTGIAAGVSIGETALEYGFFETQDAVTYSYDIRDLVPGNKYFIAVTARNTLGYGVRTSSSPIYAIPPKQIPSGPTSVTVDVNPGTSDRLLATWQAPTSTGGDAISKYRVEWDTSSTFDNTGSEEFLCPNSPKYAVWSIQTAAVGASNIDTGYFNLKLTRGNTLYTTEAIPWNAPAKSSDEVGGSALTSTVFCTSCPTCGDICDATRQQSSGSIQSTMEELSVITGVTVNRITNSPADGGYTWYITFLDSGDDFSFEALASSNSITCSGGGCGGSYEVRGTKISTGVAYTSCDGSQIVPSAGGFTQGQFYYLRLFAFNSVGYGPGSIASNPAKPIVVPALPTSVTLQVSSITELKVIFSPPVDDGGDAVTSYQIEWDTTAAFTSPSSSTTSALSGGAPFYKIISDLTKGQSYFVRVSASNSQGSGSTQVTSPASLQPHTIPGSPTKVKLAVTASTLLTVQWYIPTDDGGSTITGYKIEWDTAQGFNSLSASPHKGIYDVSDPSLRSYTLSDLTPGRTYYVRVQATNEMGAGLFQVATPSSAIPVNVIPGKPHTLTATATATSGELLVSWQSPRIPNHGIPCGGTLLIPQNCILANGYDGAFGGTNLIEYEIQWNEMIDFSSPNNVGTGGIQTTTATSYSLSLTANKLFYVRVLTRNAQGMSSYCGKANEQGYLCPDALVLLDGTVITGSSVSATTAA